MNVYISRIGDGLARNLRLYFGQLGVYELVIDQDAADRVLTFADTSARVFGKWCDSVTEFDDNEVVELAYVDDVVAAIIAALEADKNVVTVGQIYRKTGAEIRALWALFEHEHETLDVADQGDDFTKRLYATFVASLPINRFAYDLASHSDDRGSFTEILHLAGRGQVSVIVSKCGKARGQHWHHTKIEKFIVVSGEGEIALRPADCADAEIIRYRLSGTRPQVVRIPPGYVHRIDNLGTTDMVTVIWTNEVFDAKNPDTYRENV